MISKKQASHVTDPSLLLIGWYEWCQLTTLHIPAIKAKIDTGAKTSSLHAFNIKPYRKKGIKYVRFDIHPLQRNNLISRQCQAQVVDQRFVISSSGHKEHRYVIKTQLQMADRSWEIELTLANRDLMQYRMLLGREAMQKNIIIDPNRNRLLKKYNKSTLLALYNIEV